MSTGLAWGGGDCAGSARLWGPAPPGWDLPAGPWLIGRCSNLRLHQRAVGSTWPFHPRGAGEGLPAALQVSHHPEPGVGVGFWPCLWFLAWGLLQSSLPPDKDLSGYKPRRGTHNALGVDLEAREPHLLSILSWTLTGPPNLGHGQIPPVLASVSTGPVSLPPQGFGCPSPQQFLWAALAGKSHSVPRHWGLAVPWGYEC